jgi:Nucleotide modification associated domain 1
MTNTNKQFDAVVESSRDIYSKKTKDYGTSWRVLRTISIVDQIFIKAKRIRTIQEIGLQKIGDDIASEFKGILNYAIIGIIQLGFAADEQSELTVDKAMSLYDEQAAKAKALMQDKNHDYGEAWRDMSQESFTDLILSKLLRIKQIIGNDGKTVISEGIDANYYDIINYAAFALILIEEGKQ